MIIITSCPEWHLEDVAENMHLVLKLRSGQMRRFKVSRRSEYASYGPNSCLLRSAERQLIIDFLIRLKIKDGGAELDTNTELGSYISQRFPLHAHATLNQLKHCWVTFWKAGSPGDTSPGWSPVTNPLFSTANFCYSGVLSVAKAALDQPLDAIAEYYGDRIAFYFAFVAYYTRWLVVPSVLGSLVFVCQLLKNDWDHWLCIPFGLLVMVWAAFMFEYWKQESSTLAYRWGAIGRESHEIERPQFKGVYVFDRLSLEIRKKYPTWRRVLKYCVTFPIVLLCIFAILLVMLVVFVQQSEALSEFQGKTASTVDFSAIFSDRRLTSYEVETVSFTLTSENLSNIQFWVVMLLYPSFYGIVAVLAAGIFDILATLLNDWENHRTQNDYNNGLVLKIFSFRFVTIYSSLFFYAFFTPTDQEPQFRVGTAILCLLTIGQWWSKICDTCIPFTLHKIHLYFLGELGIKRVREERVVESVALQYSREPDSGLLERSRAVPYFEEALLPEYSPLGEYTNIVIQIGFILFFSIIFPLVPLLALLTNVLLLRIDAFKVLCVSIICSCG